MADDDEPKTQTDADKGGPNEPPGTRIGAGSYGTWDSNAWSGGNIVGSLVGGNVETLRTLAKTKLHPSLFKGDNELGKKVRLTLDRWEERARREDKEDELAEIACYRKQWELT